MHEENPRDQSNSRSWKTIAPYAILSLVSFLCGLVLIGLLLWNAEKLVALGLTGNLYYLALLPLGLSAAAFLFGALRSYAHYSGTQFGGALELGGPVVAFLLVVILGFFLPPPASNFLETVFVHGAGGQQDLVLRSTGLVVIDIAGYRRKAPIDQDGAAIFPEIPANFRGQEVPVALDAEDYELVDPHLRLRLTPSSVYVEVRRKRGIINGSVRDDDGKPLAGVSVAVAGIKTLTNESGYFELAIPGDRIQPSMTLTAVAPRFVSWSDAVVSNSNDVMITLQHER